MHFLLRGNEQLVSQVGYTADSRQWPRYKVVIVPSPFFDDMTLQPQRDVYVEWGAGRLPVAFGNSTVEQRGEQIVVYADVVATAFYLLSRHEEMQNPRRDEHGRFLAAYSWLYAVGHLNKPLLDEYGAWLYGLLTGEELPDLQSESRVVLTHDVDILTTYRRFRSAVGAILRGEWRQLWEALQYREGDPSWTFPWLFFRDYDHGTSCKVIYFLKATQHPHRLDYPMYSLSHGDGKGLLELMRLRPIEIGLHVSYAAGIAPEQIGAEKAWLEQKSGRKVTASRHHYLASRHPQDMRALIAAGLRHDYTMGYPDVAGFRLGTSRPVQWIDPQAMEITPLWLHPLTAMDCTLSDYMHLLYDEAYSYACGLIDETQRYGGELVLLWHNHIFNQQNYHKDLYPHLLAYAAHEETPYYL